MRGDGGDEYDEIYWRNEMKLFLKAFDSKNNKGPHSIRDLIFNENILNGLVEEDCVPELGMVAMSKAVEDYGDFAAYDRCLASKEVHEVVYGALKLVFLCHYKIPLRQLTEDTVLAMRDAAREAVASGFDVGFLLLHLRNLVFALFGRRIYLAKLDALNAQIQNARKELSHNATLIRQLRDADYDYEEKQLVAKLNGSKAKFDRLKQSHSHLATWLNSFSSSSSSSSSSVDGPDHCIHHLDFFISLGILHNV